MDSCERPRPLSDQETGERLERISQAGSYYSVVHLAGEVLPDSKLAGVVCIYPGDGEHSECYFMGSKEIGKEGIQRLQREILGYDIRDSRTAPNDGVDEEELGRIAAECDERGIPLAAVLLRQNPDGSLAAYLLHPPRIPKRVALERVRHQTEDLIANSG